MVLKLYTMYVLYLNHGKELKSKALPLIWCCVSGIKVDADGNSAKSSTVYILEHHVKMQFNKIPQLAMDCNVRYGGMISQGIGRGVSQNIEPIG